MSTITVTPIAGSLGAEVRGVDLRTMDNQAWAIVHQAFLDHKVIAIRGQDLGPQDMMDVGARFGEPHHYPFVKGLDGFPFLFDVIKEPGEQRNFGGGWHSDTTYMKAPPMATLLYALETPGRRHALLRHGGGLRFAVGEDEGAARQPERRVQRRVEELGWPLAASHPDRRHEGHRG